MKRLLQNIICTFLKKIKNIIRDLFLYPPLLLITKYNYAHKLKDLHGKEKINVSFLVSQNTKWNGASVYSKLMSNERFSVMILVIRSKIDTEADENYLFFKQRGYNVFEIIRFSDLRMHKPDIVFYQQPWFTGLRNGFSPFIISKIALCLYFPYSIATTIELPSRWNNCKFFFKTLYKQFLFNSDCVREFEEHGLHNTIATGHPKLDVYGEDVKHNLWRDSTKIKIIYAPHHSFNIGGSLWATFSWNGKQILQMAKDNLNTEWIFKPHPMFKQEVVKAGIMTREEVDEYFDEWIHIGQVYNIGDYFDIFRTSNLLITDCNSFLTEYLPTGNPVIHLISSNNSVWSTVSRKSSQHYYKVRNLDELESTFDMLVNQHKDPLKNERQEDMAEIKYNSADNIINELLKIISREK